MTDYFNHFLFEMLSIIVGLETRYSFRVVWVGVHSRHILIDIEAR